MHRLQFSQHYSYSSQVEGIRLPVTLKAGGTELEIFGFVDTGAAYCLFQREYAELLGLEVEAGHRLTFATVAGMVEAFGHSIRFGRTRRPAGCHRFLLRQRTDSEKCARQEWLAQPDSAWTRGLRAAVILLTIRVRRRLR